MIARLLIALCLLAAAAVPAFAQGGAYPALGQAAVPWHERADLWLQFAALFLPVALFIGGTYWRDGRRHKQTMKLEAERQLNQEKLDDRRLAQERNQIGEALAGELFLIDTTMYGTIKAHLAEIAATDRVLTEPSVRRLLKKDLIVGTEAYRKSFEKVQLLRSAVMPVIMMERDFCTTNLAIDGWLARDSLPDRDEPFKQVCRLFNHARFGIREVMKNINLECTLDRDLVLALEPPIELPPWGKMPDPD